MAFLAWGFCFILAFAHSKLQGAQSAESLPGLGVNWGSLAAHPLDPHIVVNMLKDNGIKKLKLFDADSWTVSALSGTEIEVMVGIPNDQLDRFAHSSGDAEEWVKENVTKHLDHGGVNIRYVAVGNEPFLKSYNGSYIRPTLPAMRNIRKALEKAGLGDKVKVTTPLNADVCESGSDKPSRGDFRADIHDVMKQVVSFLDENKSPFVVNIYPFISLQQNKNFPENLAFFDGNGKTIDDDNVHYSNVFDAVVDTLVSSLKKSGFPNVEIVIGEVGWPTDGDIKANANYAEKFYEGFLKKMAAKKGTPLHPAPLNAYLFSLFDENLKSIAPGNFERHWGIFHYDGKPKFPIDFSGQGQEIWPTGAKGVRYQDRKWCVLSSDVTNMSLVPGALGYACSAADCTSLSNGSSCGNLDLASRTSYAFNQFFQTRDQSVEACDFSGMGSIVTQDPSTGSCSFYIEIVSSGHPLRAVRMAGGLLVGFVLMFMTFI